MIAQTPPSRPGPGRRSHPLAGDPAEHAVDERDRLVAGVDPGQLQGLVDAHRDRRRRARRAPRRCPSRSTARSTLPKSTRSQLSLASPMAASIRTTCSSVPSTSLPGEGDRVGGHAHLGGLVGERRARVLRGPLQLEEDAQGELASPPPPPRGTAHGAKTTSLTWTLMLPTSRPSIRSTASATRCCTSAPPWGPSCRRASRPRGRRPGCCSPRSSTRAPRWAWERRRIRSSDWPGGLVHGVDARAPGAR